MSSRRVGPEVGHGLVSVGPPVCGEVVIAASNLAAGTRSAATMICSPAAGSTSIRVTQVPSDSGMTGSEIHHVLRAGAFAVAYRRSPGRNDMTAPDTRITVPPAPAAAKSVPLT